MPLFDQDVIPGIISVDCTLLIPSSFENLLTYLGQHDHEFWGISAAFKNNGDIVAFGLATTDKAYVITDAKRLSQKCFARLWSTGDHFATPVGFNMASIALGFYRTFNARLSAIDLGVIHSTGPHPIDLINRLYPASKKSIKLQSMWSGKDAHSNMNLCLQAWISLQIAELQPTLVRNGTKMTTVGLSNAGLRLLSTCHLQLELAEHAKPTIARAEFSEIVSKNGTFELKNLRFKTRIRPNAKGHLVFKDSTGKTTFGRSMVTNGKTTHGVINGSLKGRVKRIMIVGKEPPNYAEEELGSIVLNVLLGKISLQQFPYVRLLWKLPGTKPCAVPRPSFVWNVENHLNASQNIVLNSILGNGEITLAHGPPGTGKTTVITAAARELAQAKQPLWIIAHSNVAVKNIGEKLFKENLDFKLIVSKDFYREWHEDIYHKIETHLIRSDNLPDKKSDLSKILGSSKIMLCTLSMVSNQLLKRNGMFDCVPMQTLVVDEASQINVFEYLPIFTRFHKILKKVCFFGDPNQLPPFRQDQISAVKSIFDLKHISAEALFLQEQYRMPKPVGDFISKEVYHGRLLSFHPIVSESCVTFVDACGSEESKRGSYMNRKEIKTIVLLMRNYYHNKSHAIITPYDAQRAAIIEALKASNLPSENVFNVDSFQGNEADYILISVVRDKKIGFLSSNNRINVMLTRLKKGMVIVANQNFIEGVAKNTLLGRMSSHWSKNYPDERWIKWTEVAARNAKLPGV